MTIRGNVTILTQVETELRVLQVTPYKVPQSINWTQDTNKDTVYQLKHKLGSYIGLCVDCNSFVRRNFPAICCSAGCRVAFGLRCISSLELQTCLILSVCHCGVATVVNVVREPQVAFTLQPYLWLAS